MNQSVYKSVSAGSPCRRHAPKQTNNLWSLVQSIITRQKITHSSNMSSLNISATRLGCIYRHMSQGKGVFAGTTLRQSRAYSTTGSNGRKRMNVLASEMSYLDTGVGGDGSENVVIFLHGNPTSSYLWRNVVPHVQGIARCLAPDLIGMGQSGKEPNNSYRFVDHYRYMSTWIDQLSLPEKVTIVCHDWGSGLGFHWCNKNRHRVQAIVHMESLVAPSKWEFFPEVARGFFQAMRSDSGEEMVLKKNLFVERLLPGSIMRPLTEEEMDVYRAPYREPGESRRPTLTWPREIPIIPDGPEDVVAFCKDWSAWLSESSDIPKLYIDGKPGFFSPLIRRVTADWPNQETVQVKGLHFLQEDSPDEIGQAIRKFLQKVNSEQ